MTKEQLAAQLNEREYSEEITREEESLARNNGLIVIFGASDDLLEFRGAVHEELGAYGGTTTYLIQKKGKWEAINEDELEEYKETLEELGLSSHLLTHEITARWAPRVDDHHYSWEIVAKVPHAHFDIMEDEEFYCRGIVLDIKDL